MEKRIKTCGMVLFIKSIIEIIISIVGLSGGLVLAIGGKIITGKISDTGDALPDSAANCSNAFFGTLGIVFGIIAIVLSLIIGAFALTYFIHSRKLLYTRPVPEKSRITLKTLEILSISFSTTIIVIFTSNSYILMAIFFVIVIQSLMTAIALSKIKINNQDI